MSSATLETRGSGDDVAGDAAQSNNWGDDGKSENLYVDESQQLRVHR